MMMVPLVFILFVVVGMDPGSMSRGSPVHNSASISSANGIFQGLCPEPMCDCFLDHSGRMEIACLNGQMEDIPMQRMNPSTEVIRIVGPDDRQNHLTIGRMFRQFKRLEELHIVGSNVPNIGENSFWGVQSLRVLNLSKNNISIIVETNFKGLVNVENLSLAENSIESLVSASFQNLPQLKTLNLSRNRVTKLVERLFYNLHMLEVLDLSENRIMELNPDVFRDIWRLRDLRCRRCALKTINPLLYALLPGLQVLDLGENEFKYLNKEEFSKLPKLHTLLLDGNQISAIVDHTFDSAQLTRLSLGSNRIVRIDPKAFYNATIVDLDLSHNKFEGLDKQTFTQLRTRDSLKVLDLSRNPKLKMSPLIVILGENPQLEGLSLAYNGLDEIPLEMFELQGNLRYLNISGNRLFELHVHQLSHLLNLQRFDISHNRIKGLDSDILLHIDRVSSLKEIRLEGNPWHCDLCHIVPLLRWVHRTQYFKDGCTFTSSSSSSCLRCTAPSSLEGRSLGSLDEDELTWCSSGAEPVSILSGVDDPRLGLFLGCALIIIILLCAAIYVIVKARWHAAHYYTHEGDRPEIATPPVPPPQDVGLFPEQNGSNGQLTSQPNGNNGFDNALFQQYQNINQNTFQTNGYHPSPLNPSLISPGSGCGIGGGGNGTCSREKMIATIEEMTYETQLAYPELAPIHLQPPVRHPPPPSQSSSSTSARSTPIYCCPSHHHHNNNNNGSSGGDSPPPRRSMWNTSSHQPSFRRY